MKENSENRTSILDYDQYQYVIEKQNVKQNDKQIYRNILLNHKFVTIVLNDRNSSSLKIDTELSFGRIIQLGQIYPEESVFFTINKEKSFSVSDLPFKGKKSKKKLKYYHFQSKTDTFFFTFIKLLYILYLVAGILIFVHLLSLILKSECKFKSFYLWFSIIQALAMLYLGKIGVSKFNEDEIDDNYKDEIYDHDYMFWYNLIVLILTMCTFIFLINEYYIYIKSKKFIGIVILSFYIIILLMEIIALLFYDLTNKIFQLKKTDGYTLLEGNEEFGQMLDI
jgi:hypothetical protein